MSGKHKHETKAPEPTSTSASTSTSEPGPAGPEGPAGPPGPPGTVHPLSAAFLADEFGRLGGRKGGALQRLFMKWLSNPDKDPESITNPLKELIEHRATELSRQTGVKIEPLDYIKAVNRFQHLLATVF